MIYCLMTEDKKIRVEIQCPLISKPNSVFLLAIGVEQGYITMIKPKKFMSTVEADAVNRLLDTDWERNGVQPMYINWIPTENL